MSAEKIISEFKKYLLTNSADNSGKVHSYINAINKLNHILKEKTQLLNHNENLWLINNHQRLMQIYQIIKEEQKKENGGFFARTQTPSYWQYRYYSSAIKTFASFLIIDEYEKPILKLSEKIQDGVEFAQQWEKQNLIKSPFLFDDNVDIESKENQEKWGYIKLRENQNIFRKIILRNYQNQCCLSGLPLVETLQACHISSWQDDKKNRLNPENGLCLTATYHIAFDRNLIALDDDYRLILSPTLKEYYTNEAFKFYFKNFENQKIQMPIKFLPSKILLEKHRDKLKK